MNPAGKRHKYFGQQLLSAALLTIAGIVVSCSTEIGNPEADLNLQMRKSTLSVIGQSNMATCSAEPCDTIPVYLSSHYAGAFTPSDTVIRFGAVQSRGKDVTTSKSEIHVGLTPDELTLSSTDTVATDLTMLLMGGKFTETQATSCEQITSAHTCLQGTLQIFSHSGFPVKTNLIFVFTRPASLQWQIDAAGDTESEANYLLNFEMGQWLTFNSDVIFKEIKPTWEELASQNIIITENRAPRTMKALWDNLQNSSSIKPNKRPTDSSLMRRTK